MRPPVHQPGARPPADTTSAASVEVSALTRRMVAGEESAYCEFYDAYYGRLLRYLFVVAAGDEETAAEVLGSTLLRVVRHIKVFTDEKVFWSWLTVLARSAFSDHSRKRRRYLAFLDRFTTHSRSEQLDLAPGPVDAEAQMQSALERTLAGLPDDERELVEWKYFARRSVRDIAAELQTSEKAVESRLGRIRQKLKSTLLLELKDD